MTFSGILLPLSSNQKREFQKCIFSLLQNGETLSSTLMTKLYYQWAVVKGLHSKPQMSTPQWHWRKRQGIIKVSQIYGHFTQFYDKASNYCREISILEQSGKSTDIYGVKPQAGLQICKGVITSLKTRTVTCTSGSFVILSHLVQHYRPCKGLFIWVSFVFVFFTFYAIPLAIMVGSFHTSLQYNGSMAPSSKWSK